MFWTNFLKEKLNVDRIACHVNEVRLEQTRIKSFRLQKEVSLPDNYQDE